MDSHVIDQYWIDKYHNLTTSLHDMYFVYSFYRADESFELSHLIDKELFTIKSCSWTRRTDRISSSHDPTDRTRHWYIMMMSFGCIDGDFVISIFT